MSEQSVSQKPARERPASERQIKLLVVLGTRPEVIKLAPLVIEGRKHPGFSVVLCSTGQHRELTHTALEAFGLEADIDLNLMTPSQTLSGVTCGVIERTGAIVQDLKPDWVVVQGDTTTAFASALAAFYGKVRVAHVEAGLRTGDIYSPWPEEMNRRLISELATLHCAPTKRAADNLLKEGIPAGSIVVTGNTVVDALTIIRARLASDAGLRSKTHEVLRAAGVDPASLSEDRLVLITCHRRESFGEPLQQICLGLADIAARFLDHTFVFPLHPNPNLRSAVRDCLGAGRPPNLKLIEPLAYVPFVALLLSAGLLITDSGGIQEEGVTLGKRVLVVRDHTERMEGIDLGLARLAGTSRETIARLAGEALLGTWPLPQTAASPYGAGDTSARILAELHRRSS